MRGQGKGQAREQAGIDRQVQLAVHGRKEPTGMDLDFAFREVEGEAVPLLLGGLELGALDVAVQIDLRDKRQE